jgi:hypothetical protein
VTACYQVVTPYILVLDTTVSTDHTASILMEQASTSFNILSDAVKGKVVPVLN